MSPLKVLEASRFGFSAWRFSSDGGVHPRQTRGQAEEEPVETVRFNFNFESLCLVLYSNDPNQVTSRSNELEFN